jgi:hypothetical protein
VTHDSGRADFVVLSAKFPPFNYSIEVVIADIWSGQYPQTLIVPATSRDGRSTVAVYEGLGVAVPVEWTSMTEFTIILSSAPADTARLWLWHGKVTFASDSIMVTYADNIVENMSNVALPRGRGVYEVSLDWHAPSDPRSAHRDGQVTLWIAPAPAGSNEVD